MTNIQEMESLFSEVMTYESDVRSYQTYIGNIDPNDPLFTEADITRAKAHALAVALKDFIDAQRSLTNVMQNRQI